MGGVGYLYESVIIPILLTGFGYGYRQSRSTGNSQCISRGDLQLPVPVHFKVVQCLFDSPPHELCLAISCRNWRIRCFGVELSSKTNSKQIQTYDMFLINTHYYFWDRVFPGQKNPGGHGNTVEKGLGPRPLGPIGPMFKRTITVTGKV